MKTVLIAGFFDPIHGGHLAHIEEAKKLGDCLIVVAGTEEQCKRKHGQAFLSWQEKVAILKKFGANVVVPNIDTTSTCADTIRYWRPNIFAKGDEEGIEPIPQEEIDACRDIGCEIRYGVGKRLNHSSNYWRNNESS
jgi:cytidyltransferase-like protein